MVRILSCWVEGFPVTSPFIVLHSGFPEVPPLLFMNGYFMPSDSLLYHWVLENDISILRSLCLLVLPLSCLNLASAVLRIPGISSLWQPLRILTQPFLLDSPQSPNLGRLSFSFRGFWASNLLGLPSFLLCGEFIPFMITCHGVGPLCYFFGPWFHDFLDLNIFL